MASEPPRTEFEILDADGLEYHRWVSDVEITLIGKDLLSTIRPVPANAQGPSDQLKAQALMFLRRHMASSLRWEYMQLKTPLELWNAFKGRFGNIQNTLLPELSVKWNDMRLLDYKSVPEFNSEMLHLRAMLQFCGKEISEADMIEKTLSTFPASAMILSNQYRLEFDNKRITTFNQLINLLHTAEKHNKVLLNNNVRPAGTKKVPETNYGKAAKGGRNPNVKGNFNGRQGPYNRPEPRGNFAPRGRGYGGRGRGHGGRVNVWQRVQGAGPSGYDNRGQNTPRNPPKTHGTNHVKRTGVGNEPCNRCGFTDHWSKNCRASSKLAADYKKYKESRDQEAYNMEEEGDGADVNLTIADFQVAKDQAQSMEAPDFD